jgi:hypothetical protein
MVFSDVDHLMSTKNQARRRVVTSQLVKQEKPKTERRRIGSAGKEAKARWGAQ